MSTLFEARRTSFDAAAEVYDRYRVGYPREVIEIIEERIGKKAPKTLEFGCGSGQLTRLMAAAKWDVTATDPSPKMLEIAAHKLPQVQCIESTFETWPEEQNGFDCVATATAFHWFDKSMRFSKMHQLLSDGGVLAIMANTNDYLNDTQPVIQAINAQYQAIFEQAERPQNRTLKEVYEDIFAEVKSEPLFEDAQLDIIDNTHVMDADHYVGLMQTHSDTNTLPSDKKALLLEKVHATILNHGDKVIMPYQTMLITARKKN